jgi:hypothetical protein
VANVAPTKTSPPETHIKAIDDESGRTQQEAEPGSHAKTSTVGPTLVLRLVQLRQSSRKTFDLTGLGPSKLGRLIAALILGGVFLLGVLLASLLLRLEANYGFLLALLVFGAVFIPSAVLILWSSDEALEEAHARALRELRARRLAKRELTARREAVAVEGKSMEVKETNEPATQECPYCAAIISLRAVKCKHCGEFVNEHFRPKERQWNPGIAALLSLLIPGAGQIYKGQVINGLFWLFLTVVGYFLCVVPGIFLHLLCIIGAASGDPYR